MVYNNKQGRCNEGFNAEPITFAFCICILHFEFKFPGKKFNIFPILVQAKILGSGRNFMIGQNFWVRVKNLCSGENFGFGRKGLGGSP